MRNDPPARKTATVDRRASKEKQDTKELMITELRITAPPDTLPARSASQPYGRGTPPCGRLCERTRVWPAWRRSRAAAARERGQEVKLQVRRLARTLSVTVRGVSHFRVTAGTDIFADRARYSHDRSGSLTTSAAIPMGGVKRSVKPPSLLRRQPPGPVNGSRKVISCRQGGF